MKSAKGATLLEILMAMIIIGLVAGGIMGAFAFGRQVIWRSHTELVGMRLVEEVAEALRSVVGGRTRNIPPVQAIPAGQPFAGLPLEPWLYVGNDMGNRPVVAISAPDVTATPVPSLNVPPDFARFRLNNGTGGRLVMERDADRQYMHGDGRLVVVEERLDLDGDGRQGMDVNADGTIDLLRVRIRVKFSSPSAAD